MTRRAKPVAVDWLWSGRHLDLKTGSLVQEQTLRRGACWTRADQTMHKRSKRHRQQQVTAVQEFQIGGGGKMTVTQGLRAAARWPRQPEVGCCLSAESQRLRPRGGAHGRFGSHFVRGAVGFGK
jgi:hypothetical protein